MRGVVVQGNEGTANGKAGVWEIRDSVIDDVAQEEEIDSGNEILDDEQIGEAFAEASGVMHAESAALAAVALTADEFRRRARKSKVPGNQVAKTPDQEAKQTKESDSDSNGDASSDSDDSKGSDDSENDDDEDE
eukprot:4295307-Pyramimonas_sp.AAC.1